MGWDIVPIAKHNLDTSNVTNLAKDLFSRLPVNIDYGFFVLENETQFLEKQYTEGFVKLGSLVKNKKYQTFLLIDEHYVDKFLLKKYGTSIFYDTKYWEMPYRKNKLPAENCIKEKIENLAYNYYNFEYDTDDDYQFISIYNHCYTNSIPYYSRWSGLCDFFESKRYTITESRNYFFEFRKILMDFTFALGSNKMYYINDQNHEVFNGIGQSAEAEMTWVAIESFLIKQTKHLMIDVPQFFSDEKYRKAFHAKKEFPLSYVDNFSDLKTSNS